MSVCQGVLDVEFFSSKELVRFVFRQTGDVVEDLDVLEDRERLLELGRLAAVSKLSVSELRRIISMGGLRHGDCVTKGLLRERCAEAVERIRRSRQLLSVDEAQRDLDERLRSSKTDWRRYKINFCGHKLGMSLSLINAEDEMWVVVSHVARHDIPALQAGDKMIAIEDYPVRADGSDFRMTVLERLAEGPRPITITFAVGDNRWPPELPSRHRLASKDRKMRRHQLRKKNKKQAPPLRRKSSSGRYPPPAPASPPPLQPFGGVFEDVVPPPSPDTARRPTKPAPKKSNDVENMTVTELKRTIQKAGMSHAGAVEKSELRKLAAKAVDKVNQERKLPEEGWADFIKAQQAYVEQPIPPPEPAGEPIKKKPPPPPPKKKQQPPPPPPPKSAQTSNGSSRPHPESNEDEVDDGLPVVAPPSPAAAAEPATPRRSSILDEIKDHPGLRVTPTRSSESRKSQLESDLHTALESMRPFVAHDFEDEDEWDPDEDVYDEDDTISSEPNSPTNGVQQRRERTTINGNPSLANVKITHTCEL